MKSRVVGPQNIGNLMAALETNTSVHHFLLGNNIIGPTGAKHIASYLTRHPNKIETWYLAGNCINADSLNILVDAWTKSSAVRHIWLKRNPLGPSSVNSLYKLITEARQLVTLDLDQTELGDTGVVILFDKLAQADRADVIPLKHTYLNANGIGAAACRSIANFLASRNCMLDSLYMSHNPVGNEGALTLAEGLRSNTSLLRLSMRSCGLKSASANAIMNSLARHPKIMTLDLGHNYAAEDLGSRYNFFDDGALGCAKELLEATSTLQLLDLGITGMTPPSLTELGDAVRSSTSLLVFKAMTVFGRLQKQLRQQIRGRLAENVQHVYGQGMGYEEFLEGEQRWLISHRT